jgi:hypothetical protein
MEQALSNSLVNDRDTFGTELVLSWRHDGAGGTLRLADIDGQHLVLIGKPPKLAIGSLFLCQIVGDSFRVTLEARLTVAIDQVDGCVMTVERCLEPATLLCQGCGSSFHPADVDTFWFCSACEKYGGCYSDH